MVLHIKLSYPSQTVGYSWVNWSSEAWKDSPAILQVTNLHWLESQQLLLTGFILIAHLHRPAANQFWPCVLLIHQLFEILAERSPQRLNHNGCSLFSRKDAGFVYFTHMCMHTPPKQRNPLKTVELHSHTDTYVNRETHDLCKQRDTHWHRLM